MAETEKREIVLRQELLSTQQSLSNCEKVVEKQKETLKKMETEKLRLMNFKQNKGKRLEELEQKVAQYQVFEKVNVEKLIQVLYKQQSELEELKNENSSYDARLHYNATKNEDELRAANRKFQNETYLKNRAIDQLKELRKELDSEPMTSDQNTVAFWKDKCHQIYQLCQEMKDENQFIAQRCKQLAEMAVNMTNKMQKE
jgi:hypothetical protein